MSSSSKTSNKKKRTTWIILAVVLVIIVLVGVALRARQNAQAAITYQTTTVEKGSLTATVGATGSVRPKQEALLTWQTTGIIGTVNVLSGDQVRNGDVLATLSQTSLPQNVILARSDLVTAQQNLDNVRNSTTQKAQAQLDLVNAQKAVDSAKATLDQLSTANRGATTPAIQNAQAQVVLAQQAVDAAQVYYSYVQYLGDNDPNKASAVTNLYNAQQSLKKAQDNLNYFLLVPSGRDIAEAQAKYDLAVAQLADAQRNWDRLQNGPTASDIDAAQARVDAAQATLDMAQIAAPFSGTVTEVDGMVGDQVSPGTQAFRVDDLSQLLVDVQVSEIDINSVKVGQPVTVTFDAIANQEYKGTVVEVAQAGDIVQGVVNFTVTVQLTDADSQVKPGMTAAVTIVVNQLDNVLIVPNRAVRVVNGQQVVYILKNGILTPVNVTLGASSDTVSEVVAGDLKVGDQIVLNPPANVFGGNGGGPFGGGF